MNDLTPIKAADIIEAVIAKGDIAQLSPQERAKYYVRVCDSVGLNPMTRPFEYITLNGKLTLYARKDCTDQLRSIYGVSVCDLAETERDGVFIVTAKVENARGRKDAAKGAVSISGLKGEALANALMKAETKAKRRATLSICGLGFLDETEVETIPNAPRGASADSYPQPPTPPAAETRPEPPTEAPGAPAASAAADAATIEHQSDPVIWDEEAERPAVAGEVEPPTPTEPPAAPTANKYPAPDPSGTTIPDFLKSTGAAPKPAAKAEQKADPKPEKSAKHEKPKYDNPSRKYDDKDVEYWINDLSGAVSGATDLEQLAEVQKKVALPARKFMTPEAYAKGTALIQARAAELLGESADE
jgi:hypothetical protein